MNKQALITGATAGIGKATALKFAENGMDVIITGRREELLEELKQNITKKYKVQVIALCFDIQKKEQVEKAIDHLPGKGKSVDILINNAGLAAGLDPIHNGSFTDWETMIDTNIKGLLYISRIILPFMIKKESGHVVNLGSIAGKEVYPSGNVYCATKHAVDALTKGMRIDTVKHGIKVTSICPGMVDTEFSNVRFKGDTQKADSVYQGLTPLYAEDIAEAIWFAVSRPQHVNINDMLIMPTAQANAAITYRE